MQKFYILKQRFVFRFSHLDLKMLILPLFYKNVTSVVLSEQKSISRNVLGAESLPPVP